MFLEVPFTMIIINIMGGLGNQMFQYAAAKSLSVINNAELKIDASDFNKCTLNKEHTFQLDYFNMIAVQATKAEINNYKKHKYNYNPVITLLRKALKLPVKKIQNPHFYNEPDYSSFKPEIFELEPEKYLFGYFNSYKYFQSIRNILLEEFTPKWELSPDAKDAINLIENTNSVSIHFRRGDYISDPGVKKSVEGIITEKYYQNTINYIAEKIENPHFFMFSNDMDWVKQNFKIPYKVTYIDFNSPQRGYEDLWIMSRCKHNITAGGSTFSWWAAYLNPHEEKIVTRTKNMNNESRYNYTEDYFPHEWKIIES